MASLDSLPADQRAVLQLVLQRGRSYDDIAKLLSIDRAAVRQRALAALDALGPQTGVPPERRALITDYMLGQLPAQVAGDTHDRLAESPAERAWVRVVASELAPLASGPLPEIPADAARREPTPEPTPEPVGGSRRWSRRERAEPTPVGGPERAVARGGEPRDASIGEPGLEGDGRAGAEPRSAPPSSRRGGALVLGLGGLAVVAAVVVVIILLSGGSSGKKHGTTAASTPAASTTPTTTGTTSSTATKVVGQVNLSPPSGGSTKTKGIAEVLKQGSTDAVAIVAQGIPPNTKHDAYAVWLYNSPTDSQILGFVNPGVGDTGRLSTAGRLPSNAARFKELILTLETQGRPSQPGKIILQGQMTGLS
jgi:Sigma-70, region 4